MESPSVTSTPAPAPDTPSAAPIVAGGATRLARLRQWVRTIGRRPGRSLTVVGALLTLGVAGWLIAQQVWASYHWGRARAEANLHHYPQAKHHLMICHRVWPDDRATLLLAARVARRLNLFDEADAFLTRYHEVSGENDDLLVERVLLRCERGEVDAVKSFCETLIANEDDRSPLILEALVAGHLRAFRLPEAKLYVALWQEREPDSAQAENMKGYTFELGTQQHDALQAYRRAVTLDPNHDEARIRLAQLLVTLSQAGEALPHLQYLTAKEPANIDVLVDLARCLVRLDEQEEAEKTLARARALKPDHAAALQESGLMALRRDQLGQAETWLREACKLAPGEYQVHYQLALCLQRAGKAQEARALEPQLRQMEQDGKRMQEILGQLMSRAPNDPNLHFELGMIAMRAGAVKEGLRWFKSALQADPAHAPTHEAFASFYRAHGQIGRAAKHLEFVKSKNEALKKEGK